jgi:Na+/melibiose symporter-like transporter
MKINYNEREKIIEIKDGLKNQYVVIYLGLIFTFVNSVIQTLMLDKKQMQWTAFIWIILGILSMILLTYQILKKTASEKLNVSEISSLVEKNVFGRKRISLKLKNGKLRDLMEMKKQSDITRTKELFKNIGVKIS